MGGAWTVDAVRERLAALEDPGIRAVNERHGDDHGVHLTKLRALAKEIGPDADLARGLWATGDTAARLVAILLLRLRACGEDELDGLLREARAPKVHDWLVGVVVQKGPHAEALRERWLADPDPVVASAGWALTSGRVGKGRLDGLDLSGLLDTIEAEMGGAPERLQWAMNWALTQIGVADPALRARAVGIGERLGVLRDYPTPPGCTSPFAPVAIAELVRRRGG